MTDTYAKDLLVKAKEYAQNNDFVKSLSLLKKCKFFAEKNAVFCNKIAKFSSKISENCCKKRVKIALLSSSTTTFLEPILKYFLLCDNINAEIKSGDFGSWKQDILDEDSWLSDYNPDAVIISVNWRDANLRGIENSSENCTSDIELLWNILAKRLKTTSIFQVGFDLPKIDSGGFLAHTLDSSKTQTIHKINSTLLGKAKENNVVFIDTQLLQAQLGLSKWEDAQIWYRAKQHPSLDALPAFASGIARAIKAKFTPQKKVCVLDLDNTLWGGVISEDGISGIRLGSPDAVGEAFEEFQQYLLELKQRGILLAICSKNDENDAVLPFEKHPSSRLKLYDFVSFKANWNKKSDNIKDIAKELNLGIESFVFVDDNPVEIAEVSTNLPEVECVLLPTDPSDFIECLDSRNFFDTTTISDDDTKRSQAYIENAMRESVKTSASSLEDYLQSLQMKCLVEEISDENIDRVEQLLGKTNQFNMTTRRHSAQAIKDILKIPKSFGRCFKLKDKFGNLGIVGVVLATEKNNILEINSFVMSCRAMGRGLENLMLNETIAYARNNKFTHVIGEYIATEKNQKIKNFYSNFGFANIKKSDTVSLYKCDISSFNEKQSYITKV